MKLHHDYQIILIYFVLCVLKATLFLFALLHNFNFDIRRKMLSPKNRFLSHSLKLTVSLLLVERLI